VTRLGQGIVLVKLPNYEWRHSDVSPFVYIGRFVVDTIFIHESNRDSLSVYVQRVESGDTAMCRHFCFST
jgi:hypothetical protein